MADPILVLAPDGRDAEVIRLVLDEVGLATRACADLPVPVPHPSLQGMVRTMLDGNTP